MTEASKKRMEELEDAMVQHWRENYRTTADGYGLKRYGFKRGYEAGMQDPEANSEVIDQLKIKCEQLEGTAQNCFERWQNALGREKQLEGLLGECEKYIHRIKDHSVSKGYLNVVGLSRQMIYLIDEYKELKAAKEGGE